ncbi:MAG: alkaline phosphatase D family protein [Halioglobus sp.]
MPLSRRSVLKWVSASTFILPAGALAGSRPMLPATAPAVKFDQGVASADPQVDAVMLWTRAEPVTGPGQVTLLVQVSVKADFSELIIESAIETGPDSDYTVRAHITGLDADSSYFYRFIGPENSISRHGRTRTAPAHDQDKAVNIAFVSCQSFEQAYYGAWARMIEDDIGKKDQDQIQFVLQLGDFIYERSWNTREDGSEQSRRIDDFPDGVTTDLNRFAVSLADYRHLYKIYLSDPHLQDARARWPFISTWDDHEFANDNFQSYSTYGGKSELAAQRKLNANKAWFEFIPSVLDELSSQQAHDFEDTELTGNEQRDNAGARDSLCIYRKLNWGAHVDIVLTDTRSYRSGPCLPPHLYKDLDLPLNSLKLVEIADYGRDYNNGNPPEHLPYGDGTTLNPARDRDPGSCLGEAQRNWFLSALAESTATWKLWGNSLPLMPMHLDLSSMPLTGYEDSQISVDAWSGYPWEFDNIMSAVTQQKITGVVSLSGDHHLHGAATIKSPKAAPGTAATCVDFACAGISSTPFFESILAQSQHQPAQFKELVYQDDGDKKVPLWHMTMLQGTLASFAYNRTGMDSISDWLGPNQANSGLEYLDCTANGYGLATFAADSMSVDLVTMTPSRQPFKEAPAIKYTATFKVAAWQPGGEPALLGPEFAGGAPFPFNAQSV